MKARVAIDYPNRIERGSLRRFGELLDRWVAAERPLVVVSDETVAELHWETLRAALWNVGRRKVPLVTLPPGEKSKCRETVDRLIDSFLGLGVHRRSVVVAFGGGVICDTVGYTAATYMRGIDYVNAPTTLIGQVDAGIGGKVGVNHSRSKNFIGAFHHPLAVLIDPDLLATLDRAEMRNGLAEAIKVAVIDSAALFELLEARGRVLLDACADRRAFDQLIEKAVRIKLKLLHRDPFEDDLRRVLNFGHTFAHPLEVNGGFEELRHGYAVAIGMAVSARVAARRGCADPDVLPRLIALLQTLGLPTGRRAGDAAEIWAHADVVRRIRGDNLHFVLPHAIGSTRIIDDLTMEEFAEALAAGPPSNGRAAAAEGEVTRGEAAGAGGDHAAGA